jgi:hypothetical protein
MEWILEIKVLIFYGLLFVVLFMSCFLALYAFHAVTKGHHFREWKEFEPLDSDIASAKKSMQHQDLRWKAYNLLEQTIIGKFDCTLKGEKLVYAVITFYNLHAGPNSTIDKNDINFTMNCLDILNKLRTNILIKELHEQLSNQFPNHKFYR